MCVEKSSNLQVYRRCTRRSITQYMQISIFRCMPLCRTMHLVCEKGVPILHERIGEVGTVSWVHAAPFRKELGELEAWFSDEASVALRASPDFQFFPVVSLGTLEEAPTGVTVQSYCYHRTRRIAYRERGSTAEDCALKWPSSSNSRCVLNCRCYRETAYFLEHSTCLPSPPSDKKYSSPDKISPPPPPMATPFPWRCVVNG